LLVTDLVKRVIIVGGGSAGWLTAGIIAAEHRADSPSGLQVILVESPGVNPIGVGEGTWPTMRDTLRRIGVSETDFLRECDASFKQGSKFAGWATARYDDHYHHPFVLPQGYTETDLVSQWQARHPDVPFAYLVSYQPHLCEQGKAPKQVTTPEFAAVANYAYHLDAGKFGEFLKRHCTQKLGVRHVVDHVTGIESTASGDIAALHTAGRGRLDGDLFIDCTGFSALLIGQHYSIPFISRSNVLFNDTALAVQVPYEHEDDPIASQTISTAQAGGWIWDIGLPTRRGIGHVYSASHVRDEEAERALRSYLERTAGAAAARAASPRKISFKPGHRETFWHRNCVAVGISAGFIEPLEASALALIELSAAMICDQMPATRDDMYVVGRRFNDWFSYRWERIVDFLKLHYVLSRREDSGFWIDNRRAETIPDRLRELLALWRHQPPSRYDFHRIEEIFPSASYQYVLYGMGFRPEGRLTASKSDDPVLADRFFRETAVLTAKMLAGLPTNRQLLAHVRQHRLHAI
jgi:2-polyprenyl-6-methoxyphenol hydroxylase-like FAD-dependent oxidoreductase